MSNAVTDSNSNPIGLSPRENVTVSSVTLSVNGPSLHKVFLVGQFSADTEGATGGMVTGGILVDGNLVVDTQVNNLQGETGTLLSLSGVITVKPGTHRFDLQAFAGSVTFVSVHHRSLTAVDLEY
jgi:hypothetical protein